MLKENNTITRQIATIGEKYGLDFILLHGSKVTGKTINPESDTDIAVYRRGGLNFKEELSLISEFAHIYGDDIDVKTLHKKNPLFLFEVIRNGKLLYGNEDVYKNFVMYVQKIFIDTKQLRDNMTAVGRKKQRIINQLYA